MTKSFFAASLLVFLLSSNVSAWDMSSYVETAQAAEEKNDSTHIQKTEQKQSDTTDNSKEITDNHVYRGLYFSAGIAFGYTSLNLSQNDWRKNKIVYKFSGLSIPYAEARLGHYFANILSVYGTLGIGIGTGEYEASSQKQETKIDAISMRGIIGLGAELYPFQEKESALYGLYLGLCIGAAVERVQEDDDLGYAYRSAKTDLEIFDNTFARIEIGYDFWFGQRWRVGTAFSYSFGKYDSDDDDDIVTTSHNFSLAIRIAR